MAAAQNQLRAKMAEQFLEALKKDQLPWKACWQQARPQNAITGKRYRGVNALYLSYYSDELGYTDPRWCTYRQAKEQGWQVRKGETGCRVEYWAYYDMKQKKLLSWKEVGDLLRADPDYEKHLQLRSRIYTVFNAAQIDGIPALLRLHTDIGAIRQQRDTLLHNMAVGYREQGSQAYYTPGTDTVTLPPEEIFDDTYSYMATLLHECGHATGHPSRLDRDLSGGFGSENYAREELRAEIASAFTAQALGLQMSDEQLQKQMQRHMAYVQSWAAALEDAPEELFRAIKAAEQISDYLLEKGEFQQVMEQAEREVNAPEEPAAAEPFRVDEAAHAKFMAEAAGRARYWENPPTGLPPVPLASPRTVLELAPRYPWANRDQLGEIALGTEAGLSPEQVSLYAREEFSGIQMNSLRYAIQDGLPPEQIRVMANPAFDSVQMDILRASFQGGIPMERVLTYAKPEIPAQKMLDTYWFLRKGTEPSRVVEVVEEAFRDPVPEPEPAPDPGWEPEL